MTNNLQRLAFMPDVFSQLFLSCFLCKIISISLKMQLTHTHDFLVP